MKKLFKKILIIWAIICVLLPTFTGFVYAAETGYLNTERAGNFASNFAINFYENWSSITYSKEGDYQGGYSQSNSSGVAEGDYIWPIKDVSISSGFGPRWNSNHKGLDLSASMGTEIMASNNGVVVEIFNECPNNFGKEVGTYLFNNCCGRCGNYGNHILIDHQDGVKTMYAHCTSIVDGLKVGDTVDKGQLIGTVGTTGQSTGAHLHFEYRIQNVAVDPNPYMHEFSGSASYKTKGSIESTTHGEVKTEYDVAVNPMDEVDPKTEGNYKFNNISWIGFAYRNSLFKNNVENVLTGSGDSITINTEKFNDKSQIPGVKEVEKDSKYLDIASLLQDGKIKPGDILYCEYTLPFEEGTEQDVKEYLLYVGGSAVIYATEDPRVGASGALKYEYLESYFKRIRQRIKEAHSDEEDFEMPKYGVSQVYRIKDDVANRIPERDANLFFDGKGYYSKTSYDGMPSKIGLAEVKPDIVKWLFEAFKRVIEFLINLLIYILRMVILGWANMVENLIQHVVLGISGDNNDASIWNTVFGTSATSASGDRVTVEAIFYNQIPILDANFFNMETAGGHDMFAEGAEGEYGIVYTLKSNLRNFYVIIRSLSIAIMLFLLLAYGIRIALTSSSQKKAEYKKLLTSWFFAFGVVLFIHIFMFLVFELNDTLVGICKNWENEIARKNLTDILQITNSQQELNLYDAVRTKAYAFDWHEGVPATLIYIYLIYLMIRFLFIYVKRYMTIYLLAVSGAFMGVKYAIDRLMGKKTTTLNKWAKDFAFNVLLQTVHAFIYLLFIGVAISVSEKSLGGAIIAGVILNFMLKADKIIIKIFGLDKAGSLATVNEPESWRNTIREFFPIYTITKGALGVFGGNSEIYKRVRYFFTDADNLKDAKKQIEKQNYNIIGGMARKLDKTPIRKLSRYHNIYKLMGNDLDNDTNKKILAAIKASRQKTNARYVRRLNMAKDLSIATAGKVAGLGLAIANPSAGIALLAQSRKTINKYKTTNKLKLHSRRYGGSTASARAELQRAINTYKEILDRHTNNELLHQEQFEKLKDDYSQALTNAERARIKAEADALVAEREKQRAIELHELAEATDKQREAKAYFNKAKMENNVFMQTVGRVAGLTTAQNMAENEIKNAEKAVKDDEKADKKVGELEKIAKLETELRKATADLKKLQKEYAQKKNMTEEETEDLIQSSLKNVYKQSKEINVKSSYIARAVSEYLARKDISKVTGDNVSEVLDELKVVMERENKTFDVTDELKNNVKEALESKMISDKKGLGLDKKDTIVTIRQALVKGKDHLRRDNNTHEDTDELERLKQRIEQLEDTRLQKINDINTRNEVGKIKYKSSLVSVNKIIKETSK